MTLYSFHVAGDDAAAGNVVSNCATAEDARVEAIALCKDFARNAFDKIGPDRDWQLTVTDDTGRTVFRFRISEERV